MKTKFTIGFILILLALLQSTVLEYVKIFNTKPDIILVAVVIVGLFLDWIWVLIFGYLAGMLKDILGASPFGLNTLILPLLGFSIFRLSKKIIIENNLTRIALVFMAVILENLVVLLYLILIKSGMPIGIFFRFTIIGSIYTALLSPLIFKIFRLSGITPSH